MLIKPGITVSSLDVERLEKLMARQADASLPGLDALQEELDRANLVAPAEMPETVVTMNSTVRFQDLASGREFCRTLVYPASGAPAADCISIFAPVGSALLGLSEGDDIDWPKPGGGVLKVRILEVVYQPERAGELHR
ncbi:nucleoside diphosphate kinase regulator [Haliea sp. E17]|uniref:nucleoside diphosphate kinase regulator n=1 Tax=Haliea sp. E17 TaxID=3401576 RepID=UPI003AAAE092